MVTPHRSVWVRGVSVYTSWRGLAALLILIGGQCEGPETKVSERYRLPRLFFTSESGEVYRANRFSMKKISFLAIVLVLLLTLGSCARRLTDFTVISTKNIPLGEAGSASLKQAKLRVKGEDKAHMFLYFPLGTPNMKDAIDRAIEEYPGAVGLVDGVVKYKSWWAILYGQNSYIVEGTPLYVDEGNRDDRKANTVERGDSDTNSQASMLLFFHRIKSGETLDTVAEQYNVSVADIIKWNELDSNQLKEGEKLKIYIAN